MEYVKTLIFDPITYIINYPITMFGITFSLFGVLVFSFLFSVLLAIIRFFLGGKD